MTPPPLPSQMSAHVLDIFGIRVVTSQLLLERDVPIREHKRRRNQSPAYHKRIQKKWTKRFGVKKEDFAVMFDPAAIGLHGNPMMFIPEKHAVLLRNFR